MFVSQQILVTHLSKFSCRHVIHTNGDIGQNEDEVLVETHVHDLVGEADLAHLVAGVELQEGDAVPVLGHDVAGVGEEVAPHQPLHVVQRPVLDAAVLQDRDLTKVATLSANKMSS